MLWVAEHGRIYRGDTTTNLSNGDLQLEQDDFDSVLSLLDATSQTELDPVLRYSWSNGRDCLTVQQYVGVIRTAAGCQFEILPKLSRSTSPQFARQVLVKMLVELEDSPFKEGAVSLLSAHRMSLFELLLQQFLSHVGDIVRKGIARNYVEHQGNLLFLRGKLQLTEHIKRNVATRSRLYCQFDEYETDRPINRLIKSALEVVQRESQHAFNQQTCREFLFWFDRVPTSIDPPSDFRSVRRDRHIQHYQPAMPTCRLILEGLNPLTQSGENRALSMLFPMGRVFEDYVAAKLQTLIPTWKIRRQVKRHSLIENHVGEHIFGLIPDLEFINGPDRIIADTKWKLIDQSDRANNYQITQADVYQMFAYAKKYLASQDVKRVLLIYPRTDEFVRPLEPLWFQEGTEVLYVVPYDLDTDRLTGFMDVLSDDESHLRDALQLA